MKRFQGSEWSGPAWYSIEKNDQGFPVNMILEYFHPLHLGDRASTDWEGKELMKVYKTLVAQFPEIGKTWIQGNIHSHHNMGAFFSGTDNQQLIDGANENFYGSLVVSTHPGKEFAFAISYPDQYGQCHITHGSIEVEDNLVVDDEIVSQAEYIEKAKGKRPKTIAGTYINKQQTTIFDKKEGNYPLFEEVHNLESVDMMSREDMHVYYSAMQELPDEEFEKFDKLWFEWESGHITEATRDMGLYKLGLNSNGKRINKLPSL